MRSFSEGGKGPVGLVSPESESMSLVGGLAFGAERRVPSRPRPREAPKSSGDSFRGGVPVGERISDKKAAAVSTDDKFVKDLSGEETKIRSPRSASNSQRADVQELDSPLVCKQDSPTLRHPFAAAIHSYKEGHALGRQQLRRWPWQRRSDAAVGSMWAEYLNELGVPPDNPGRRHLQNVFGSHTFLEKVDVLLLALDSNRTGHVEQHEFRFLLDGMQGRMRPFLRGAQGGTGGEPDVEFVLSERFKMSLCEAIQSEFFTWRQFHHPWALPRATFRELLQLTLAAAIRLAVDAAASGSLGAFVSSLRSPVAVDFCLLMDSSPEGSTRQDLFCNTVFDLHVLCPPQASDLVDGTIDESSREFSRSDS